MYRLIKNIFFKYTNIKTFLVTRLQDSMIEEKVFLKVAGWELDISSRHSMICLEPFCIAVWMDKGLKGNYNSGNADVYFYKGKKLNASIGVSLMEEIIEGETVVLLYKVIRVGNFQFNPVKCFMTLYYLLRNKTSTYAYRRTISALYSYPRKIIIVSYRDDNYCNVFPMDIQGFVKEGDLYVFGLRTTNKTLDAILKTGRVVVSDTANADLDTVYALGRHQSASPPKLEDLPFGTVNSELFNFPVPEFSSSYKEIEIVHHRKLGYHMFMLGRIVNKKEQSPDGASLFHLGFLLSQQTSYTILEGTF